MELFAATTVVTIENGKKAFFCEAPWLDGIRPEDIVTKTLEDGHCVTQVNTQDVAIGVHRLE
jgi:hypothetical protein